jgi:4a-hydroxytetrahydrobiopterin dehydratase
MSKAKNQKVIPDVPPARQQPLNRRYDFGSYAETRDFLDQMADLSKREDYYPNVSFGKTYVNVSIDGDGQTALQQRKSAFIADMDALASPK